MTDVVMCRYKVRLSESEFIRVDNDVIEQSSRGSLRRASTVPLHLSPHHLDVTSKICLWNQYDILICPNSPPRKLCTTLNRLKPLSEFCVRTTIRAERCIQNSGKVFTISRMTTLGTMFGCTAKTRCGVSAFLSFGAPFPTKC